jgi:CHASE2 domain-containing sensor protein
VIGLDVILDRYTEPRKDEALRWVLRHTKAKMVLGVIDEPKNGPRAQSEYFLAHAPGDDFAVGHLYFEEHHSALVVSDHVIRFIVDGPSERRKYPGEGHIRKSFAQAVAHAAGTDFVPQSRYISWLLPPADGAETFMTLAAEDVLGRGEVKLNMADLLRDKIVLIGGNFDDRDQHLTPLSVSRDGLYTGVFIHAQILAQLLAGRSIREMGVALQLLLALAAALGGHWVGRRSGHYHVWLELGSVAGVVLLGVAAFSLFGAIFPCNLVVISLLAGAAAGHYGRTESASVVPKAPATQ